MILNKNIKTFLILFFSFILLVQPTFSLQLEKKEVSIINNEKSDNSDLRVFINKLEFDRYVEENNERYAIYKAEYSIKNIGTELYEGKPMTRLFAFEFCKVITFESWVENWLELDVNDSINLLKEIKIFSSEDPDEDIERCFADWKIIMTSSNFEVNPPYPDCSIIRAKYWNGKNDYNPSLTHLMASTPWRYETNVDGVNLSGSYYLDLKDFDNLPNVIKERLGYVKDLSGHLSNINENIKDILQTFEEDFLSDVW